MAQVALQHGARVPTLATSVVPSHRQTEMPEGQAQPIGDGFRWTIERGHDGEKMSWEPTGSHHQEISYQPQGLGSTGKGILIGMLSAFGSAAFIAFMAAAVYFFRYTQRGRIMLDSFGRPGEYDDEQQFLREEEEALEGMDDMQRSEYQRAKAFVLANPPESVQTDISLSQFLAIQEKGVSAWEFEPELEVANCFVEGRTEIEFFDSECSVQSNLPIPKQNEVYYWEAKLFDKPDSTLVNIGVTTKPYPLFRLPGYHRYSIAYTSTGHRRVNQPFSPTNYGPPFVQGDVIGCGYRPRTGTIFFTRNGKRLEEVAHGLKTQNFFPTIGANGPCNVHVNFGQMGFVFIEANVKKWGLAPQTGSLAPPPPYGSEAGSILLEGGREGVREGQGYVPGHTRTSSAQVRLQGRPTRSPGPERSPTDISLSQLNLMDSATSERDEGDEGEEDENVGEGTSENTNPSQQQLIDPGLPFEPHEHPPPDYESPEERDWDDDNDEDGSDSTPRASEQNDQSRPLLEDGGHDQSSRRQRQRSPPIPTYEAATGDIEAGRGRSATRSGGRPPFQQQQ